MNWQSSGGEFEEIGHSGGQVIFNVVTSEDGRRAYQVTYQSSRPVPMALFSIYALPQGIPIAPLDMGGIGSPWPPPPFPGCIPVFVSSDSQGLFGHQCPKCQGYWRSRGGAHLCPYCGVTTQRHNLLTQAQRRYVLKYCNMLNEALSDEEDGDHVIDMNAVADAVGKDGEKPPFYYVEERQQHQFTCTECEGFNDIIGTFAYCSQCGTRNDLHELQEKIIPTIRAGINSGRHDGTCLRDVASAFDSFVFKYIKQLLQRVPMIPARRNRLENMRFHHLSAVVSELSGTFGIDLQEGLKSADVNQAHVMFCRRHVYEHNGGEVDEKYLQESGDTTVRLKQSLRENAGSLHQFANSVARMATNLHNGFHLIYPPEKQAIKAFQERKARMAAHNKGHAP